MHRGSCHHLIEWSSTMKYTVRIILFAVIVPWLFSCAVNPVTGKAELMLLSEEGEISMGQETDPQIVAMYGVYNDGDLDSYVENLGDRMARISHRPNLNYEFKIMDSPAINAFAVPGGYVYFTRGILAYLDNEAQLAGVMGHEIGHITARHSAQQYSKAQLAQAGLGLGAMVSEPFANIAQLAGQGLSLLFLKFSRDNERQADQLGVEYSSKVGYDAREMAQFFAVWGRELGRRGGAAALRAASGESDRSPARLSEPWPPSSVPTCRSSWTAGPPGERVRETGSSRFRSPRPRRASSSAVHPSDRHRGGLSRASRTVDTPGNGVSLPLLTAHKWPGETTSGSWPTISEPVVCSRLAGAERLPGRAAGGRGERGPAERKRLDRVRCLPRSEAAKSSAAVTRLSRSVSRVAALAVANRSAAAHVVERGDRSSSGGLEHGDHPDQGLSRSTRTSSRPSSRSSSTTVSSSATSRSSRARTACSSRCRARSGRTGRFATSPIR